MARYHSFVIRRFYVHNFRCLENFELPISGLSSVLLIGKNGSGKTAVGLALEVLQKIGRGTNRVGDLVKPKDLARGRADVPMRFEIEVELGAEVYAYTVAFELPKGGKELRVLEEKLEVDGEAVYVRQRERVDLVLRHVKSALLRDASQGTFEIAQSSVALPIIPLRADPQGVFRQWLARIVLLRPMPGVILGDSEGETLEPDLRVTNFGDWFSGVLASAPSAYSKIDEYLKQIMPDLKDIQNPEVGTGVRSLVVRFSNEQASVKLLFADLSDGEKCFMICALVLAAQDAYGPLLCFWDEPDNYLALDEVGHFVLALRRAFHSGGQFIATSHNPEAIRAFSDDNTLLLHRRSHLEPTLVRKLSELHVRGDLVGALIRGDVEPDERQQG